MVTRFDEQKGRTHLQSLMEKRGIRDERVLQAIRTVPRHLFVPEHLMCRAYEDEPLPISGPGKTISQPFIVAAMTEMARPEVSSHALEIGTGSGYQAAVLAELCESVHTIESDPKLYAKAKERLTRLCYRNVTCHEGDGFHGYAKAAPYDLILITCSLRTLPTPVVEQLKVGGRLVAPIGAPDAVQVLRLFVKRPDGKLDRKDKMQVRFVPFVHGPVDGTADSMDLQIPL